LPTQGRWRRMYSAEGQVEAPTAAPPVVYHTVVFGNYFETLGVRLKQGRYFTGQDREGGPPVLIINETAAGRFFPGRDPVGLRLKNGPPESDAPWSTVVGVVGDVNQAGLDIETEPHTYQPYDQAVERSLRIAVKAAWNPANLVSSVIAQVQAIDPQLPVADLQTMEQVLGDSLASRRFNMLILTAFAAVAMLLAAIGIFGVMAYSVARRTHEFGIRMAMGASRREVVRLVLARGMVPVVLGIAAGLAGALALSQVLSSLLYGVRPTDPITFAGVPLLIGVVAVIAACWPAHRATRVDPVTALRCE
ncbi:MAG: FtsX-like permease family protein, partial [Acidobacteriota bacterium]